MSRMTVIVEKFRKSSSSVKKYDFCVVEHNFGKLDTKASDRVIISVICLQNAENVTRNGPVITRD